MAGSWTIEDDFEITKDKNSVWSNKWKQNAAASAQVLIVLDFMEIVARNMRNETEGVLNTHGL